MIIREKRKLSRTDTARTKTCEMQWLWILICVIFLVRNDVTVMSATVRLRRETAEAKEKQVSNIQESILKQLSMATRPPQVDRSKVVVPKPVMDAFHAAEIESRVSKSEAILRPSSVSQGQKVTIFGFQFPLKLANKYDIFGSELSFYKLRAPKNETMSIRNYRLDELCTGTSQTHSNVNFFEGWVVFDVRETMRIASSRGACKNNTHVNVMFSTECTNCAATEHLSILDEPAFVPYISVHMRKKKEPRRRKRSRDKGFCHSKVTTCCKRPFTFRFIDINWHDWIVAPTEFSSNFCQGTCDHKQPNTLHGVLTKKARRKGKPVVKESCCVAKTYRAIRLLYLDEDKLLYHRVILDTAVTECGCA